MWTFHAFEYSLAIVKECLQKYVAVFSDLDYKWLNAPGLR